MDRIEQIKGQLTEMVREFRTCSGLPIADQAAPPKSIIPVIDEHFLMHEEFVELWQAVKDEDAIEIADAYCDIVYFALGACMRFGVTTKAIRKPTKETISRVNHYYILEPINALDVRMYGLIISMCIYAFENKFPGVSFMECFAEVHQSNMTKFCSSKEQAEQTRDHYAAKEIPTRIERVGGLYVIRRESDDKVLKSIDWQEPNLHKFIGSGAVDS